MKWAKLYGPEYVNRLYAMVRSNVTGPLRFVCLTDDPTGIRAEVECLPCTSINVTSKWKETGWRKISLFAPSERLLGFTGDWLFIDLDVVVTGNMDGFFEYEPERPFVVMRNWTQMDKVIGNTSVYRFRVGCATHLLEKLEREGLEAQLLKYPNSQTFISNEIGNIMHFWPDAWCALFKVQCIPAWPMRLFQAPVIPKGCKIIAFPGMPNPPDAAVGSWPEKKFYKRLYKRIRPAHWIPKIWQESEDKIRRIG